MIPPSLQLIASEGGVKRTNPFDVVEEAKKNKLKEPLSASLVKEDAEFQYMQMEDGKSRGEFLRKLTTTCKWNWDFPSFSRGNF